MKKFLIPAICVLAVFFATQRASFAQDAGVLVPILTSIYNSLAGTLVNTISQATGISITNADATNRAVLTSAETINANSDKNTVALLNASVAIEDSRRQQQLNTDIATLKEKLQQPGTTCGVLQASHDTANAGAFAAQLAGNNTRIHAQTIVGGNPSNSQSLLASFNWTTSTFCDDTLAARGLCSKGAAATNNANGTAGADINASNLFGAPAGAALPLTYTPATNQQAGADAYIGRIVVQGAPETLQSPSWDKTVQGKAYVELTRQLAAYRSLAANSLNQIEASHAPNPGLPGGVSQMGLISQNTQALFSADAIKSIATSTEPNKALNYLAQVSAYRLMMDFMSLQQGQRTEALVAAQLALQTDAVLKPQLRAQQQAAAAAHGNQ